MATMAPSSGMTVHGLFLRSASRHPDRIAIEQQSARNARLARLTYGQVRIMAVTAARLLRHRGVGAGCIVATCVDEGHLMIITQLAVLLAGGAFVPIDPNLPSQRIAYMLQDSQASCVLVRGTSLPKISEILRVHSLDRSAASISDVQRGNATRGPMTAINVDDLDVDSEDATLAKLGICDDEVMGAEHAAQEMTDRVCWVYYTSGSTGQPKGVLCEHRNAVCYLTTHPFFLEHNDAASHDASSGRAPLCLGTVVSDVAGEHGAKRHCRGKVCGDESTQEQHRVLVPSAFTFDPSAGDVFATLAHGGIICLAPRVAVLGDLGSCLSSMEITHVCSTPAVWRTVKQEPCALPKLQVVALGGESMPDSMVARWSGAVRLLSLYGTTEATVYQLVRHLAQGDSPKLLGGPLPYVRVQIVDAEASLQEVARACRVDAIPHTSLPLGSEGELVQIGGQVARGYVGRSELSGSKFGVVVDEDGRNGVRFYRSGDLVKVTEQGILFVGRSDLQVKVQGVRCELGEIESVLGSSALVQQAVVTLDDAKTHTQGFLLLCPAIAAAAGIPSEALQAETESSRQDEIRDALATILDVICRRSLPATICPRCFYAVSSFPTGFSGKIDRNKLTSGDSDQVRVFSLRAAAPVGSIPSGARSRGDDLGVMEKKVAHVWRHALGLPEHVPLSKSDSFLLCGGDSLAALSVIKRLVQWSQSGSPVDTAPFEWPPDGVVQGPLHVKHLLGAPTLTDYAAHLESHTISLPWSDDHPPEEEQRSCGIEGGSAHAHADLGMESSRRVGLGLPLQPLQRALNVLYLIAQGRGCHAIGDVGAASGVLVRSLCDIGVPPDGLVTRQCPGTSPLHVAAAAGRLEVVKALLDAKATVNLANPARVTALQLAAASSASVLSALLDAGAPVRGRDAAKQTLVHHAARAGNLASLQLLLQRGALADINAADKWNRQALHWAVLNNHLCVVETLLSTGALAEPAPVPDRVHRRRTSLKSERPAELALRLYGEGPMLRALLAAGAAEPSASEEQAASDA